MSTETVIEIGSITDSGEYFPYLKFVKIHDIQIGGLPYDLTKVEVTKRVPAFNDPSLNPKLVFLNGAKANESIKIIGEVNI